MEGSGPEASSASSWPIAKVALVAAGVLGVAGAVYVGVSLLTDKKHARRQGLKKAQELFERATTKKEEGDWEQAEELFEQSFQLLSSNLTNTNDDTVARCLFELSICCLNNGKDQRAQEYGEDVVEILTLNHGEDSPELLDALINLAGILISRRRLDMAEEYTQKAKGIIESQDEIDHGALSAVYRTLSGISVSKKDFDQAERLASKALMEFEQSDIEDPQQRYRHQLECYMLLGRVYSRMHNDKKAEESYSKLIDVARRELVQYFEQKKYQELENNRRDQQPTKTQHTNLHGEQGEDDIEVAMTLRHLGEFYEGKGKKKKAERKHKDAIEVVKRKYGNNDSNVFAFINYLAHFYWDHNMDTKANELYKELKQMTCLPTPSVSKHLVTKLFAFTFHRSPTNPFYVVPLYVGELNPTKALPPTAFLEVEFEDPANPKKPIFTTKRLGEDDEDSGTIVVLSPPVSGVKPRTYEIVIRIYEDETKEVKLGEHHQMCQSVFDTDKIRTEEDVFKQIPKDSFLS